MFRRSPSRLLVLALCAGYFLVLLDVTVVNVALPTIGRDLGAGAAGLAWVVDAYTVPLAALLLAAGALGDRLGHRRIVLAGFAAFGAASVLCATAGTLPLLVAGRAVQGVGAALALPGTLALLTRTTPDDRARARLIGLWAAIGGAALPAGPVLGGVVVEWLGWHAVFWLNVPVIAAAAVVVVRAAEERLPERTSTLDLPGAAALVLLVAATVTAIIESRRELVASLVAAAVAVAAAVLLVVLERRVARPLLWVPRVARARLSRACAVAGLMNLCVLGTLFLLTQVFQDVQDRTPLEAGLLLLPAMLPLPLLGGPAAAWVNRIGAWRTSAAGLTAGSAGFVLTGVAVGSGSTPLLVAGLVTWGVGIGVLTPAVVTAAMRTVPEAPGIAAGASNTARQTGGAIGIALGSALAGDRAQHGYADRVAVVVLGCAVVFALASAWSWSAATARPRGVTTSPR